MKLYTKAGDKGKTSFCGGRRLPKSDLQVEACGNIDELTSFIGLVASKIKDKKNKERLTLIQKDLYQIMAFLSGAKMNLGFLETRVKNFEKTIDKEAEKLPKTSRFILISGSAIFCWFHVLRTICRRAERTVVKFLLENNITIKQYNNKTIIQYFNRLSDLFFILARCYNTKKEVFV